MNTDYILFESELTDGSRLRKYGPKLSILIFVFYAIYFIYRLYNDLKSGENETTFFTLYVVLSVIVLITALVLYFYMKARIIRGHIKIFKDKVELSQARTHTYSFDSIDNLEIQRGSTYHYSYQVINKIVKVGNFLRFSIDGEPKEFEFLIDSKEKNQSFESAINTLQQNRIKLHYTSI